MQWFQIKEQSAGKKRLILSWYLYKLFGKNILYIIAFFVAFFTFIFAKNIRGFSKKYFTVIENKTGLKPTLINTFKHIYSYAESLVDKILVYSGNFDSRNLIFDNENDKEMFFADIYKHKGVFCICSHIGNIEILQSLFIDKNIKSDFKTNIFLSNAQSQVFNDFLKTIKLDFPIKIFPIEDIGLNTGIELKENLNNGDIVFIAGDRLAEKNEKKIIEAELFNHKVSFPKGTFKLAKLMETPTYFISAIKEQNHYRIILEKQISLSENDLIKSYIKYLEKITLINPFQFFHFYDFFN